MKLLFERLLESECHDLFSRGIRPRFSLLSQRVTDLASEAEVRYALAQWLKKHRHPSSRRLLRLGLSPEFVTAFSKSVIEITR